MKFYHYFRFFLTTWLLSANFLFSAPFITNLSPNVGPPLGGTFVTITGSGFTGATSVTFGTSSAATFVVNADTTITVLTPIHAPQAVPVVVTTPSGSSPSPISHETFFTYQGNWQAYVANREDDTVSVIDVATNVVTNTITVGTSPIGVALTPDGSQTYVANNDDNSVSVINTVVNSVVNVISPTGDSPEGISITSDGKQAYVSNFFDSIVSVIDVAAGAISTPVPVGNRPTVIAILPNVKAAYVANLSDGTITVIDPATNLVITTITVGNGPAAIGITPDQTKVYVTNQFDGTVSVIDTATNLVTTTITVGPSPSGIAITPDGTKAYVTNGDIAPGTVSVIDVASDTVTTTITVGFGPLCVIFTKDGTKAYVANSLDNTVSVINVATDTVTTTISVNINSEPHSITITPDGKQVYVPCYDPPSVSVIDTATDTAISVGVGGEPLLVGITPDQAPLARFTGSVAAPGFPSIFDASSSVSPTGTIANYFWDFGDGNTLNTTSPIVMHTYAAAGTFNVVLIVTNTAGTSLVELFDYSSFEIFFFGFGPSTRYTNNGGQTAITNRLFTTGIAPPGNIRGESCKNNFAMQTECVKTITWTASPDPSVTSYYVRRNGNLVQIIPASGPFIYIDHHRRCGQEDVYSVTAVNALGQESIPVIVIIK